MSLIYKTHNLNRNEANIIYSEALASKDANILRELCLNDLFFLLVVACRRADMQHDWIYARCREVENEPDGFLDLWSREHYKSSIITFGKTIQDILKDPETTAAVFSHTRPIAKGFLSQIKREFEDNSFIKDLFPDILYQHPEKESPRWSLDDGIIVKRVGNPKESTVEAWGLVDGQPTGKHYSLMIYDDIVTRESVTSPDMINKVTDAFGLSLNLESNTPERRSRKRYIGTRYHLNDTYKVMIDRGTAKPRIYPATHNGTFEGKTVLFTDEAFREKVRNMGIYLASSQLLQNPIADKAQGFKQEWLMYYTVLKNYDKWNFYILVDGASEKKKNSDYTVMAVIALGNDGNYYLVDGIRDRMNLTERTEALIRLHRRWKPLKVGYERYGKDSDIEHIKYVQEQEGYRFEIVELGGSMAKNDRIKRLVPLFQGNRFYIPYKLMFHKVDGGYCDFIKELEGEYLSFPVGEHDDVMDAISRVVDADLLAVFPKEEAYSDTKFNEKDYDVLSRGEVKAVSSYGISVSSLRDALRK